jgi:hypothetical protein
VAPSEGATPISNTNDKPTLEATEVPAISPGATEAPAITAAPIPIENVTLEPSATEEPSPIPPTLRPPSMQPPNGKVPTHAPIMKRPMGGEGKGKAIRYMERTRAVLFSR